MRSLSSAFLLAILCASALSSEALEDSYDCHELAETTIGWDWRAQTYSAEASTALKRPAVVKLSDLNTARPLLTGQGVTPIRKLSEAPGVVWFIEEAQAGTIVGWTLLEKQEPPFSPPYATLVSTKTYDLFGPATFTALYRCTPNRPSQ
jgi:hypothetical protein